MAIVRRSERGLRRKKRFEKDAEGRENVEVVLPTELTEAAGDFDDFSVLIHGEKKVGKTRLSLEDDPSEVLLVQFDPPQISYARQEIVIENGEHFKQVLKKLEKAARKGRFPYKRVVIDRCDIWYRAALRVACEKLAIDDPGEESFGKGWNAVRTTFTDWVDRVLRLPCGKWFICHSDWKEVEDRNGDKINRLAPNLASQADDVLNGKVDLWCAYTYDGRKRVMIIEGDERTAAGHRIDGHFLTPEGEAVRVIPMGKSAGEAYKNLVRAFNNKQETPEPEKKSGRKRVRVG